MATGKIKNKNLKNTTINGTTDSAGNIELSGIDAAIYAVLSIVCNKGYAVGVTSSGGVYYTKIVGNTSPLTPVTSTSVILYVTYGEV